MIIKKVTAMVEFEKTKFHSHETHLDSDGHRPNLFVQDCKWPSVEEERLTASFSSTTRYPFQTNFV